jgi:hypothetical protein
VLRSVTFFGLVYPRLALKLVAKPLNALFIIDVQKMLGLGIDLLSIGDAVWVRYIYVSESVWGVCLRRHMCPVRPCSFKSPDKVANDLAILIAYPATLWQPLKAQPAFQQKEC